MSQTLRWGGRLETLDCRIQGTCLKGDVNLRRRICYLLSFLRIHSPDCQHCNALETRWFEMRERLEELSWRTQPVSLKNGDHEEVVGVPDSKLPKG